MNILEFSEKIINGVGGLHDYEYHEMATPKYDRDVSVAIWVIKCLANPKCEGSQDAVQAIIERRERISAEQSVHLTAATPRKTGAKSKAGKQALSTPKRKSTKKGLS